MSIYPKINSQTEKGDGWSTRLKTIYKTYTLSNRNFHVVQYNRNSINAVELKLNVPGRSDIMNFEI